MKTKSIYRWLPFLFILLLCSCGLREEARRTEEKEAGAVLAQMPAPAGNENTEGEDLPETIVPGHWAQGIRRGKEIDGSYGFITPAEEIPSVPGTWYLVSLEEGYALQIMDASGKAEIFCTGMMYVMADSDTLKLSVARNDLTDITPGDGEEVGLRITPVKARGNADYDCIVAASDSAEADKAMADLVCDGRQDEIEIQCAANCNVTYSAAARVLLLPGTYSIDTFHDVYHEFAKGKGQCAIEVQHSVRGYYQAEICARHPAYQVGNSTTRIMVSDTCYQSLDPAGEYSIIGSTRQTASADNTEGSIYNQTGIVVKNLLIYTGGYERPIVGIDGISTSLLGVEGCAVYSAVNMNDVTFDQNIPVQGLIGVRGVTGDNHGVGNYIKNSRFFGMYEGIAITSEHFIVEDCLEHHCWYGFTIGNYDVPYQAWHPNVFIRNSVEQCYQMALLNRYGTAEEGIAAEPEQTLVYMGGSIEPFSPLSFGGTHKMLPVREVIKGAYEGTIESDWYYGSAPDIFEEGSGINMQKKLYSWNNVTRYDR